jgi:hypothetical protein
MGGRRVVFRVLVGKPEEKRSLGSSRHRWEDIIKMYLCDVLDGEAWIGFIWLRIGTIGGRL